MFKKLQLLFAMMTAFLLCGCLFYSEKQVNYYDINSQNISVAEAAVFNGSVQFRQFKNLTPVGNNFIYSEAGGLQVIDSESMWIQSPEIMIQRKLINSIKTTESESKTFDISAVLYDFVIDSESKSCRVAMKFNVKSSSIPDFRGKELQYNITKQLNKVTPSNCAVVMAEIVADIAAKLQAELVKL